MAKRILMAVTAVMTLLVGSTAATAQVQQAPDYRDEFDGTALGAGWTFRDGYADQLPADTANHASYAVAGGALTISIPGGAEHNQWWLRHAEIQRPYEGSGVYETRIDSQFTGSQQVGLSFETAPGTFMQFMLYGRGTVRGFVERFVTHEGTLHKDTVTGFNTGIGIPTTNAGSWYLRVTLDDDADPTLRSWNFEWSTDGSNWNAGVSGVYETADPTENVGAIQQVGVFAGNHRTGYDAYDANVAYFSVSEEPPVNPPAAPVVQATGTSSSIALSWDDELATDTYRVERATANDGPFTAIVTGHPDPAYTDTAVTAGSTYFYRVVAVRGGVEGVASGVVSASLVGGPPDPPDGVP
ncbi:MAG: fibronectin type III domain-containing protein, partial [Actinomycetota bacterium]